MRAVERKTICIAPQPRVPIYGGGAGVAVPHTGPWPQRYKLCLTSEAEMMSLTQALSSPLSTDGAQGKHSPLYLHF